MIDHCEDGVVGSGGYWNDKALSGTSQFVFPLWRQYCDQLHGHWLLSWLDGRTVTKVLKTDLFDEAIGAGLADVMARMTRPGGECHGVDISSVLVAKASQRHPDLNVHCGDVRCLPLAADQFDLIISDSTLDHFENRTDLHVALLELRRVLAPGGLLAITLDNPQHPLVALRNRYAAPWMGRSSVLPYAVGHTLGLRQLSRELRGLGFELLNSGHLMHAPRLLALHLSRCFPTDGPLARVFLRVMLAFESVARLPTAPYSGHFVAVLACKPAGSD